MTSTTTLKYVLTPSNLTVLLGARPYNIAKTDSIYADVVELVKANATEDAVLAVINRAQAAVQKAAQITPNIAIANGVVTFKGQSIDNSLTTRMLQMLDEGFDLIPMAKFLENLMDNPSYRAVSELYGFLEKGNMPITPDGHFMAYKAVRPDYKDIHSGTMDNSIGRVVEMPRNGVDDDKNRTCSAGLHFCSFEYLPHFAHANGHVVLVKINPRDVVAIPADYNDTKGRTCRYEVTGEYEGYYKEGGPYFKSMVYDPETNSHGLNTGSDEGDSYDDEGEGEYDVYGDGDFLRSFDDLSDAIDYANNNSGDYRELTVEDSDGDVVENIEGDLTPAYTVYADGTNMGEFDALADAKAEAIRLFATDDYSEVSVEDDDGDEVVSLSNEAPAPKGACPKHKKEPSRLLFSCPLFAQWFVFFAPARCNV